MMTQRRCRPLLGTFVEIEAESAAAIDAAFHAVARIHRLMSAHEAESELSQLNRSAGTGAVLISQDMRIVLDRALYWARHSGGRFDPVTAGYAAVTRGDLPLHGGQAAPDPAADYTALIVERGWARLDRPACIDLGGIAKGHAVDAAIAALRDAGMTEGLVNAGGDLFAFGSPRRIDVPDPETGVGRLSFMLRDRAIATSAAQRGDAGMSFAHLPGRCSNYISVTVEAARAMDADALTKIAFAGHPRLAQLLALADARAVAISVSGDVTALGDARLAA